MSQTVRDSCSSEGPSPRSHDFPAVPLWNPTQLVFFQSRAVTMIVVALWVFVFVFWRVLFLFYLHSLFFLTATLGHEHFLSC